MSHYAEKTELTDRVKFGVRCAGSAAARWLKRHVATLHLANGDRCTRALLAPGPEVTRGLKSLLQEPMTRERGINLALSAAGRSRGAV